jgi:hypothetical protein
MSKVDPSLLGIEVMWWEILDSTSVPEVSVWPLAERERRRLRRAAYDRPGTSLTVDPMNGDEGEVEEESL